MTSPHPLVPLDGSNAATTHLTPDLLSSSARFLRWLTESALPVWANASVDAIGGGFFEKLDFDGHPIEEARRTRVVARQIYVFATAERRGWMAGGDLLALHGLRFLLDRQRQPDGHFASSVDLRGRVVDASFDLYEQAFALFALASSLHIELLRREVLEAIESLLDVLEQRWRHPDIGFHEGPERGLLRANPHMHLLEATMTLEAADAPEALRARGRSLTDELAKLALDKLIVSPPGAVQEYFDFDWRPTSANSLPPIEPGHQFEWAWLLTEWSLRRGSSIGTRVGPSLVEIGEAFGVDRKRGLVRNGLDGQLAVIDADARLWPQTERIKALAVALLEAPAGLEAAREAERLVEAINGLMQFFDGPPDGLWYETLPAGSSEGLGPSRTSSLYHIVCAADVLQTCLETLRGSDMTIHREAPMEAAGEERPNLHELPAGSFADPQVSADAVDAGASNPVCASQGVA